MVKENLMRSIFCVLIVLLTAIPCLAEDASVQRLLAKYRAVRPDDRDLAMYRLDWERSLPVAQQRAVREKRPVCLVIIHARYGNITSGHC